jgi:hypothetical protein
LSRQVKKPFEVPTDRISKAIWKAATVVFPEISREAFEARGFSALGPRAPTGEPVVFEHVAKFSAAAEAIMNLVDELARDAIIDRAIERALKAEGKEYDNHIELKVIRKELIISHLISACLAGQSQRYAVRDEIKRLEKEIKDRQAAHARKFIRAPSEKIDELVSHHSMRAWKKTRS